jgi:Protein of unknown function (DUF2950)
MKLNRLHKDRVVGLLIFVMLAIVFVSTASCNRSGKSIATKSDHKTFGTPAEAGAALLAAAKSDDQSALLEIFGPEGKRVLFTGDATKDKDYLQDFVDAYDQMNRWVKIKAGGAILYVGADNDPFPIPLGQNSQGRWYFDTAAGKDELLARRIGAGELSAITALGLLADAQQDYFSETHDADKTRQYAQKVMSDDDKQNGLYWPASAGQKPSPLDQYADFAKSLSLAGGDKPQLFNGYYYQILDRQGDKASGGAKDYIVDGRMTGGFAILAFPADYRNSGIMSFIVGKDGIVYQKDLGEKTQDLALAMTEYNPGDGWINVVEEDNQFATRK